MFEQLDYLYVPSRDVGADVGYFTDTLGARLVFAIDAMGTRVAMVELTDGPPQIVLAGHLDGDRASLSLSIGSRTSRRPQSSFVPPVSGLGHALENPPGPVRLRSSRPAVSGSLCTS